MNLSDTSIRRPVTTAMIAIGLLVFGVVGVTRMPVDTLPKITVPMIIVGTVYPGAGPQEIESSVTLPLEKQLGSTPSLKKISSRSIENVSIITLEFEWGANLDAASADIRDRLSIAASALPDAAQTPFIFKLNTSLMPVAQYTLTGEMDQAEMREIADDVSELLQRVPGVASVQVSGGTIRQVHVDVDARQLADAGVTNEQLMATLQAQNLNYPVGEVSTQGHHYLLRLVGQYDDVEQLRNTVIGTKGYTPILLRSVAKVEWSTEEVKSAARFNGKPGIFIIVQRRPDANTIQVAQGVRAEMAKIERTLPAAAKVNLIFDSSDQIKQSVSNVVSNILIGGILAIMILFVLLRRFRATMFVAFSIPISVLFALFFMFILGFSINVLSMAGLAIAVGMVVDNGIVAFESIFRHREEGDDPFTAASVGASEIAMAITASTLTTVVVFLPMLLMRGLLLIFFREMVWAVTGSLVASLAVALTLIPMLASRFLPNVKVRFRKTAAGEDQLITQESGKGLMAWSERLYDRIESGYGRLIGWAVGHRKLVIIGAGVLLVVSLGLIPLIGTEFMPTQESFFHQLSAEMPIGTSFEATDSAASIVEKYVMENWKDDIDGVSVQVGAAGGSGMSSFRAIFGGASNNVASLALMLKPKGQRKHSIDELDAAIRAKASEVPGLKVFSATNFMSGGFMGSNNIEVDILGHDLATADSLTEKVVAAMSAIPGLVDVKASREPGGPEVEFAIDRQKAALYGLTPYQVGAALNTQITGYSPTVFRRGGKEYDILVRLQPDQRQTLTQVMNLTINGPMGPVPLKNLTTARLGTGPLDIEHENTQRVVRVTAKPVGVSSGQAASRIQRALSGIAVPPEFEVKVTGSYEDMVKNFRDLGLIVVIALILVFMVMASQFESFRDPFIIIFTVPFGLIGVLWALFITRTPLSVTSGLGVLILMGVVVNNGIVYIDYCNQLRRNKGMGLIDAVKEAGRVRLRPIMMTSLTTIFGLIPLALQLGEGSELWSPLGRAMIGGMVVSTFLPLIFIPVLYVIFENRSERARVRRAAAAANRATDAPGQ
jgi:hydrophobic/amphiphilic exporter-1 (mainly G- bacteria), HAE1 family